MKLQKLLADETLQAVMEVSDVGTVDPQSQSSSSPKSASSAGPQGSVQASASEEVKRDTENDYNYGSINN